MTPAENAQTGIADSSHDRRHGCDGWLLHGFGNREIDVNSAGVIGSGDAIMGRFSLVDGRNVLGIAPASSAISRADCVVCRNFAWHITQFLRGHCP